MKKQTLLSLLLLAGLGLSPARAEEKDRPDTIPYLGVAAMPVDPMLARHLKLRPGTGLLVQMVDEKSAADGQIETEDILTDLDGQLLINSEQFVTLVRLQKPGQEITLKLLREGAQKTVKVKLGERPAPREPANMQEAWDYMFQHPRGFMAPPSAPPGGPLPPGGELKLKRGRSNTQVHTSSTAVIEENGQRAELTDDGSMRHFKVTDAKGKVVFDGEVKGDADVARMPKAARELYDRLNGSTKIEIKPEQDEPIDPAGRVDT